MPAVVPQPAALAPSVAQNIVQPLQGANAGIAPPQADDSDLVEDEWVNAVKHLMNHYRHDPYALSQALTALREDYLMKRYGKRVEPAS